MARINNQTKYPLDTVITNNDFLIGSDGDNTDATKTFSVSTLTNYIINQIPEGGEGSGTVTSVGLIIDEIGTDINVTGSPITTNGNITLNIPTASASNRGVLSNDDWTTFNDKQDLLVSGTNIKTLNGDSLLGSGDLILSITPNLQDVTDEASTTTNSITIQNAVISANNATGNLGIKSNVVNSSGNTSFGIGSLNSNTSGFENSSFGQSSLELNTTGARNVAMGKFTLLFNSINNDNTAIGDRALRGDNTDFNCSNNVAIGSLALNTLNSGNNNIGIGYNALVANGNNQINIGNFLYKLSTGEFGIDVSTPTVKLDVNGLIKGKSYTVATLPVGVTGAIAYVTDASAVTYRAIATGGGSDVALVFYNGVNWIYH